MSRDVAERGRPDPDAPEASRFTELLLRAFAVERDVVSIESLYFDGDTEPLSRPSGQPQFAAPQPLGPLELVSHGEHLCQSADLIAAARSATERDLRLYHLLGTLRSAAMPSSDPVAAALGIFARSAQEALAAGVASRSIDGLVGRMREAGQLLRAVVEADDRMLISRRLLDVAHRLDGLRSESAPAEVTAPMPEPPGEPVPIESLGYDPQPEIVSIESLAPDGPAPAPASGMELSFRTYGRLLRDRRPGAPSVDALASPVKSPPAEEPAVAIDTLCYRGHAALERAAVVRHEIATGLNRQASLDSLQPLIQELLDLVPLALAES
jgi:hypothetical protein